MSIYKTLILNAGVAIAYFLGGVLGALLALEPSGSSPMWPASGVALVVLLVYGWRVLPGLFIGVFCAQVNISLASFSSPWLQEAFVITTVKAMASCLQAVVGAKLIQHFVGRDLSLLDIHKIIGFFFYGGVLSNLIAPSICVSLFYVLGMMTAQDYFFAWLTWWVGDTIGVIVFAPILFAFIGRPASGWVARRLTVATPLLGLLLLLVFVFYLTQQQERERIQLLFEHNVERVQAVLEAEFIEHQFVAEGIKSLFDASEYVSQEEFKILTQASLRHHPDIIAIEWIPRMVYKNNNRYSEAFLIRYVEPYMPNKKAVGFDITQNPQALTTLHQVIRTGQALSTGLVHLYQDKERQQPRITSVIYAPVYKKGVKIASVQDREQFIVGVVAVVYKIGDTFTAGLNVLSDNQLQIRLSSEDEVFFSNFSDSSMLSFVYLSTTRTMQAAGRDWQVSYRPSAQFFAAQTSWHVWWVLLGGLLFACFMSVGLLILTGRTLSIEQQVQLKTKDLASSNEHLHAEVMKRKQLEVEQYTRNRVLEKIAKGNTLDDTLSDIIRGLERIDADVIASIMLLDDSGQFLADGISLQLPDFYMQAINGLPIGEGQWSCGTATYRAERVIVEDVSSHPYWQAYKDLAQAVGVQACWAEPIISSKGQVLGSFAMYYREPRKPNVEDLIRIERMAELSAIAIERKQVEDELRIVAVTFQSHEAVIITDVLGVIQRVNQACTEITGYQESELIGKNARILSSDRQDKAFYKKLFIELARKGVWEGELWNQRKNGEIYPERITITAVYDGAKVTHYVGICSDITEQKATEREIEKLAFYDPLTRLANRRLLLDRLQQALVANQRNQKYGALIYMDLDRFKSINDNLGHHIGDELLIQISDRISRVIRAEDTASRLGGDEFVVLMSDTGTVESDAIDKAALVAEKLRETIHQPFTLSVGEYVFSTSIGVTVFYENKSFPEEVLEQADTAMYRSKKLGRNQVSFFSSQMQAEYHQRMQLETMLQQAIAEQQFMAYYQGQTDASGHLISAEALIRWPHPEKGMISPADFIPVADESHLIIEIGNWMLAEVCHQIKRWQEAGFYLDHVAVNISPRQFRQADFVAQVELALKTAGIESQYLMLELTEGIVIEDIDNTIRKMKQIQALGIAISIDDFGTGYSSLAYLKQLPLTQLKIDQGFVRDISQDAADEVIVETIIALAHKLELEVIAEGVETVEQLDFLQEKGCEKYQGYYFYKPMLAESLFKLR